jgi:hypothetical protein
MSEHVVPRRRAFVLVVLGCLVVALGGLVTTTASAVNPTLPTSMVITGITSAYTPPAGLEPGSAPGALVKAGEPFTVRVEFFIGSTPASFSSNTTLRITSTVGTLSPTTGVAPGGQTYALLTTSVASAVNRVGLTVTVANGPAKGLSTGAPTAQSTFDALADIDTTSNLTLGDPFTDGIGGDGGCTNATATAPVCGIVVLPRGAGPSVLLSVGACDTTGTYARCFEGTKKTGGAIVQALFAQPGDPYSTTSPATVIVRCDKSLCGTGPIHGLTVAYSLLGDGPLTDALPCPAKNTMAEVGVPCVDYVQSKRDGSGDTHMYLVTDRDIRVGAS